MVNLYIEGQLLDQYDDESVEIVSSVLDVQDITKNTGDYSKTFTVPTSKRNNKIFKHWYNATIDGGFDARTRVTGTIDIDGTPFRSGKWLLRGVKLVKGVADSYQINFYGETASLQQILGKDVLRDLDLSAFDHVYTSTQVQLGLETGLFNNSVIYTPMSQMGMFYDASGGDRLVDGEVQMRNIAKAGTGSGLQYNELRPSLKVIEIINAIEAEYPLTFTRDFFSTTEFDELYMWLSPDLEGGSIGNSETLVDWNTTDGTWLNTTTDIATYVPTVGSTTDQMLLSLAVTPASGSSGIQYTLKIRDVDTQEELASGVFVGVAALGIVTYLTVTIPLQQTRNIEYTITPSRALNYSATLVSKLVDSDGNFSTREDSATVSSVTSLANVEVSKLLPDMEISEFIKGLIQMFKLVVIGREGGDFYINSLDAYYRTGVRYDISKYVDYAEFNVERGEILSELDFKFQEPKSILAKQFLDNNGVGYGDSKVKLKDLDGEPFDGDTLTVELPFEQIMYERLTDTTSGALSAVQVGNVIDIALKPVFTKPHLHYASLTRVSDFESEINYQNTTILNNDVWMPMSHSGVYGAAYSLLFESEVSTYTRETLRNTLYSNHYENYVQAIFNVKRRTLKVTSRLPIQIITQLDLNDIITIDKLDYRINNFKYNLLTGMTDLELINGFDEYENGDIVLPSECFVADNRGGQYRFNIPNVENFTITSSVAGNGGASFVTDSVTRNQFILDVDQWTAIPTTEYSRTTNYTFTSETTGTGDIVKNGTFVNSNDWDPNPVGSYIVGSGFAEGTGVQGAALYQTLDSPLVVGCEYLITYTITDYVAGWIDVYLGGTSRTQSVSSNGVKSQYVTASTSGSLISFQSIEGGSFDGKLSNLSIIGCKTAIKDEGSMCITQINTGE